MWIRSRATVVALLCWALLAPPARAQPPGTRPNLPPAFSPYLNLARPGTNPAINYYGLVRPQNQFASSIQALQRQSGPFGPFSGTDVSPDQPTFTGHAFGFQNQSVFYQNQYAFGSFGASGYGGRNPGSGFSGGAGQPGGSTSPLGVPPPRRR